MDAARLRSLDLPHVLPRFFLDGSEASCIPVVPRLHSGLLMEMVQTGWGGAQAPLLARADGWGMSDWGGAKARDLSGPPGVPCLSTPPTLKLKSDAQKLFGVLEKGG